MRVLPAFFVAGILSAQSLPVNWRIQPAGRQIALDSLPLSAAVSPDGKFLLALNAGSRPSISVVDIAAMKESARVAIPDAGLGLAFSPDGRRVYAGSGSHNAVLEFTFSPTGELKVSRELSAAGAPAQSTGVSFVGDVAVSPDGRLLLTADLFHDRVIAFNTQSGQIAGTVKTGRRPYRILFHPDGQAFFVSSWADASVYEYSLPSGTEMARVRVGAHPTDLVLSNRKIPDQPWQYRLFAAAANTNDVFVLGVSESKDVSVLETLNTGFSALAPAGMTPSGLALSADQTRLFVVCSDANAVAAADISEARSRLAGFIPVGAYPTAVHTVNQNRIAVLNGHSNSLSIIDSPSEDSLADDSKTTLALTPYRESFSDSLPEQRSSIEHVVYVVLDGTGPSGANLSKLAREFVRFENFHTAGGTPADALNWAVAAIAPDFTAKLSPAFAAGRMRYNGFEGGEPANLPPAGYLWSNALSAGLAVRNYGLFVENKAAAGADGIQVARVKDPSLQAITNMKYRAAAPQAFFDDLKQFESTGMMPNLMTLHVESDATLGRMVEAISKSKFWPQTAIFAMDASSPKPLLLALSPYTRRGAADATPYDQVSVLRTIELILNLRPMTVFDFSARSLAAAFVSTPNNAPYSAEQTGQ